MPAISPYIIDPIWEQFVALLPEREVDHPLGCHNPRIPDRVVFEKLVQVLVFGCAYERIVGLDLSDVAVDCCTTKAPCGGDKAGKSPVDRAKEGIKRSMVVDANGVPIGAIAAPANHHDSPLLEGTLDTLEIVGELPERMSVHLDRGYDSKVTRERLQDRGFLWEISQKGKPAPLAATKRWVVERTNSWQAK